MVYPEGDWLPLMMSLRRGELGDREISMLWSIVRESDWSSSRSRKVFLSVCTFPSAFRNSIFTCFSLVLFRNSSGDSWYWFLYLASSPFVSNERDMRFGRLLKWFSLGRKICSLTPICSSCRVSMYSNEGMLGCSSVSFWCRSSRVLMLLRPLNASWGDDAVGTVRWVGAAHSQAQGFQAFQAVEGVGVEAGAISELDSKFLEIDQACKIAWLEGTAEAH